MDPTNIGEEVTVKKATLLERITRNRAGHRKEFHLALEGWHAEAVAELDRWKEDLSHGRRQSVFINRPIPEDHTRDYDLMIAMLEMHLGDEVTIPRREFSQMVMDDWHWKQEWKTSNARYVATGTKLSEAK